MDKIGRYACLNAAAFTPEAALRVNVIHWGLVRLLSTEFVDLLACGPTFLLLRLPPLEVSSYKPQRSHPGAPGGLQGSLPHIL